MPDRVIRKVGTRSVQIIEDLGLWVVLIATVVAGIQEVLVMLAAATVRLSDLLLMFIYIEVVSMVKIYWESGKLPVRMPLYIAIVAMARYLIIDVKNLTGYRELSIAAAALILALTVFVVRYGHLKYPYPDSEKDAGRR